jgi:predicted DCC family thiol-disulfide oxidoreductase YuxK
MLLTLIYDGGCPFCREFALRSELKAGVPNLRIVDGRADHKIRHELNALGLPLRNGAVLMEGEHRWHGSEAIAELSRRMKPSDPLLKLLSTLFCDEQRSALAYPALLAARRIALATRGLSVDPDQEPRN